MKALFHSKIEKLWSYITLGGGVVYSGWLKVDDVDEDECKIGIIVNNGLHVGSKFYGCPNYLVNVGNLSCWRRIPQ